VFPLFRSSTLFILALATGYSSESHSAAALTPADQLPLRYTALFGGAASIAAIAVDANGSAFITGAASSALPVTPGAFQTDYKPATCASPINHTSFPCPVAFAAKLTPDGTAVSFLTYLGTSSSAGSGISVDAQGNAWITGTTASSDLPFTPDAFQATFKGSQDAFLLKLNPAGSRVLFASYLGGTGGTGVASNAIDANGNLYVAGNTSSTDLPATKAAFQTDTGQNPGSNASFVAKFDSGGKLVYLTYFHGGNGSSTSISSIAPDAAGNAYVTGTHNGASLPTTPGAFQTSAGSPAVGFAAKLDSTGSKLLYCTYLAANSAVSGSAIAVDSQSNAYIAGNITLNLPHQMSTFPVTPGAFQTNLPNFAVQSSPTFGFVTKLNAVGSALGYSTFLYASDNTYISRLTLDAAGSAVIVGTTYAPDFPTTPGALRQCNPNGGWGSTGFMLKLAADGSHPIYSTYLGADGLGSVTVDGAGQTYITGSSSGILPIVPGSFGWTASGAFVASLAPVPLPAGSVSCAVSAASRGGRSIAPGEIIDVFGNGIGPAQTVFASAASGQIPTSLGGVQVLFNGIPSPLLLVGPNQIRTVVPFETAPATLNFTGSSVTIQILNGSTTVQPVTVPVAVVAPAIFTADGRPAGQALMINEDGTLNSEQNPARQGSIVTIYATGLNNTQPPLATGLVASGAVPLAFESSLQAGSAGFGEGGITYAGAAPGFVAGLIQINFRIPSSIFHGFSGLYLTMSPSFMSQVGVYFYLQ
jgi:uncharacterized protein (TIGR03437 family)